MSEQIVVTPSDVRAWARENGHEVGLRGRIPSDVAEAFNKGKRGAKRFEPKG